MKFFVYYFLLFSGFIINEIICLILNENNVKFENYFVLSTLIKNYSNRSRRNLENCFELSLILNDKLVKLCLIKSNHLFDDLAENAVVIVQSEDEEKFYDLKDINITHTTGYVIDKPYSSSVAGYIERRRFFGKINIETKCYYVEKINKFPWLLQKFHLNENAEEAVVFERNLIMERIVDKAPLRYRMTDYLSYQSIRNKLCTLLLFVDNSFLRIITKNNVRESISIVLHNVYEANSLFRSTDFNEDGIPDNIGFLVKEIIVDESTKKTFLKFNKKSINGNLYLQQFSRYHLLRNVCLGIAFTAQTFEKNVIGLSYTPLIINGRIRYAGGICERSNSYGDYLNSLVITYRNAYNGELLPQMLTELSLSHELGHSFGAPHDLNECYGYLMTAATFHQVTYKNFLFSKCSKRNITNTLKYKSFCLINTKEPFCGNGILEDNEECDCGYPLYCQQFDACCLPKGTKGACSLNKYAGYECHPSQGLCCTSKCKYKDLSHLGINCKNFNKYAKCTQETNNTCGILANCMKSSCQSNECTRIGLEECICPADYDDNATFCRTCCLDDKRRCLSALHLTRIILKQNETLFMNLKKSNKNLQFTNTTNYVTRSVCFQNTCLVLSFRVFLKNNLCLYKGQVGHCNENYQCIIHNSLQIYPSIRTINKGNQIFVEFYVVIAFFSLILYAK